MPGWRPAVAPEASCWRTSPHGVSPRDGSYLLHASTGSQGAPDGGRDLNEVRLRGRRWVLFGLVAHATALGTLRAQSPAPSASSAEPPSTTLAVRPAESIRL